MWDLGSGDIVVLVSVISGWAVLLKIFGPLIGSTITIGVILCGWLIYNIGEDASLSPHVFLALNFLEQAAIRTSRFSKHIWQQFILVILIFARNLAHLYRVNVTERMAQRRRSTYQLSAETGASSKSSSRFSLVDGLSPIQARGHFRNLENSTNLENTPFLHTERRLLERANSLGQLTSTPLMASKKDDAKNGDVATAERRVNNWKNSQSFTQNHTLSRGEETNYSPEGSPWGTSISPKMRPRAAGVKTVQTVAGPLLASTRYNIDPKVFSDVTSPGLTTRLTKYATEANTKLTHQSQYGTGQFPRVNFNSSPTPLMSAKTGKMRMPVTVRIAPPKTVGKVKYKDIFFSKTDKEKKKLENSLREISLKRHASREDVTYEMAKKQRTDIIYFEDLMTVDETTEKRGRDDSSRSEEETASSHCEILRPAKRSKMPSCHDILSSLSSSINVSSSSGVKRKAIDVSRSGTPVVGKHFKSLDSSQSENTEKSLSRSVSEPMRPTNKRAPSDSPEFGSAADLERPTKRCLESIAQKQPENASSPSSKQKVSRSETRIATTQESSERKVESVEKKVDEPAPVKLTEKLFMRARPENIDKIKTLIEEHGSIKPRFTTDSTDEIKKSDIVNMRQTSMKNRLKSMFDAISGKGTSKINPEVVIQAEDKSASSESIVASLSSSTSTTNVNTSPIATSAIVPIIGKSKQISTAAKHVTFQISSNDTSLKTSLETPQISTDAPKEAKPSQASETTSSVDPSSVKATSPTQVSATSIATSVSSSTPHLASPMFNFTSGTSAFGVATTTSTKPVSSPATVFQSNEKNSPAINFSFGVAKPATTTGQSVGSLGNGQASDVKAESVPSSIAPAAAPTTTSGSGLFSFTSVATVAQPLSTSSVSEAARSTDQATGKSSTGQSSFWASSGEQVPTLRSPGSSFGVKSSAPASATPTGFTYTKNPMSEVLFGASSAGTPSTTAAFTMGTNLNSSATAKPVFSFGTTTPTIEPAVSFGASSSMASPSTQTNLFRVAATTASPSQPSLFGSSPATTVTATTTSQTNLFGAPAPTPAPATTTTAATLAPSIFAFGNTSGQSPSFSNTFGLPKSSYPSSTKPGEMTRFTGITVPAPSTSSSTFSAATKSSGLFGTGNTEANPTTSSAALPSFGQKPAVPTFGSNSPASSFSKSNVNTPSLFEAQSNEQTFGATSSAAPGTSGAPPSYTFSNATAASTSFGIPSTAPLAFGSTNTLTTSFGATTTASPAAATTFGSLNTTTPIFGAPNSSVATITNQNTTSLNFSPSSTTFGATATTAPPAFPTATTSGFGTSAGSSTFGSLTNPSPAFSTAKTFGGFGAPANTTLPFGSQPSTTNSSFGTANTSSIAFGTNASNNNNPGNNNNNNIANASFTFGSSQPNCQQPQQQNAIFTFGGGAPSTAANNTTTGSPAFQFNSAPQQTGGFNFTGAPAAPTINFSKDGASGSSFALPTPGVNSFSVPPAAGGMFSIGTGSTAPRTRPSRRRQR